MLKIKMRRRRKVLKQLLLCQWGNTGKIKWNYKIILYQEGRTEN